MMKSVSSLFLQALSCMLLWSVCLCSAEESVISKTWVLYHSLGKTGAWTKRGTIALTGTDNAELTVENDASALSESAVETLLQDKWYRLKLEEEGNPANSVMTTVNACQVRRSNFRDEISLTFGRQGRVLSFSYMPMVSPLAPKTCGDDLLPPPQQDLKFQSRISYETAVPGMTLRAVLPTYQPPPGLKYISTSGKVAASATTDSSKDGGSKKKADGAAGFGQEEGEQKPEEQFDASPFGFLKRYWYIIVPMMLMNMFGGGEQPPANGQQQQEQGGAQQQQQQGGGGAAPQGQAAPASGGKRRGKRSS